MSPFRKIQDFIHRRRNKTDSGPRRVRIIPGAVPRSPLERRVLEVLAAHPGCPWDHLVAVVAQHLRRSEHASVLTALDEGFWSHWVWPTMALEELTRLDGVLFQIEVETASTTQVPLQVSERPSHNREDVSAAKSASMIDFPNG